MFGPEVWAWFVPGVVIGGVAGLLAYRKLFGKRQRGYLCLTEYHVYTTAENLPPQEKLMDRMISSNPHNRPGRPSIGAREGMLFTDVRLHLALARREKNAQLFRPDLFSRDSQPSADVLEALSQSRSMVVCRYATEEPIKDTRHLQFLPHLADAVADLSEGLVVHDCTADVLWTRDAFTAMLAGNNIAERPEFHVRVVWEEQVDGAVARTLGLRKVGLTDLQTPLQESDNRTLIEGLLLRLAFHLVRQPGDPGPYDFDEYGDTFVFKRTGQRTSDGAELLDLTRRQTR